MKNKGQKCLECDRDAACKGYCFKHYQQKRLRGSIIKKNYIYIKGQCRIIGCPNKILAKGLCQNHYRQEKIKLNLKQGASNG